MFGLGFGGAYTNSDATTSGVTINLCVASSNILKVGNQRYDNASGKPYKTSKIYGKNE